MHIGVPQETSPGERRVALVPESCKKLIQLGYTVSLEAGAGEDAGFSDSAYREVGVGIEADPSVVLAADLSPKPVPKLRTVVQLGNRFDRNGLFAETW